MCPLIYLVHKRFGSEAEPIREKGIFLAGLFRMQPRLKASFFISHTIQNSTSPALLIVLTYRE
jgi:hypothetical protein